MTLRTGILPGSVWAAPKQNAVRTNINVTTACRSWWGWSSLPKALKLGHRIFAGNQKNPIVKLSKNRGNRAVRTTRMCCAPIGIISAGLSRGQSLHHHLNLPTAAPYRGHPRAARGHPLLAHDQADLADPYLCHPHFAHWPWGSLSAAQRGLRVQDRSSNLIHRPRGEFPSEYTGHSLGGRIHQRIRTGR